MLKFILASLLGLFCLQSSLAQQAKKDTREVGPYEGIIRDSTVSKAELYKRCKTWALSTFRSYDNNITFDDATADIIATTPVLNLEKRTFRGLAPTVVNRCSFKLTILFKEGRLKYLFDNFTHQYTLTSSSNQPAIVYDGPFTNSTLYKNKQDKMQPELDGIIRGYIVELEKAVKGGLAKSDW